MFKKPETTEGQKSSVIYVTTSSCGGAFAEKGKGSFHTKERLQKKTYQYFHQSGTIRF